MTTIHLREIATEDAVFYMPKDELSAMMTEHIFGTPLSIDAHQFHRKQKLITAHDWSWEITGCKGSMGPLAGSRAQKQWDADTQQMKDLAP